MLLLTFLRQKKVFKHSERSISSSGWFSLLGFLWAMAREFDLEVSSICVVLIRLLFLAINRQRWNDGYWGCKREWFSPVFQTWKY